MQIKAQNFGEKLTKQEEQARTQNNKKNSKLKEVIAKLSKGLMLPVAMLPIAGLFLGIGSTIISQTTTSAGQIIGKIFQMPGNIVFAWLPLFFAISIAIAFTNDSGVAALSSVFGYAIFIAFQTALIISPSGNNHNYHYLWYTFSENQFNSIFIDMTGIKALSTSIFGGMCIGAMVAILYNKYKSIELPKWIGFFSGVRFIPIITFLFGLIMGMIFSIIWPIVGMGIYYLGQGLALGGKYGGITTLIYGILNRALVPFGLHHVLNIPLWFSDIGGSLNTGDTFYLNGQNTSMTIFQIAGDNEASIISGDINMQIYLIKIIGKTIEINGHFHTITIQDIINSEKFANPQNQQMAFGQYTNFAYVFGLFGLPGAALGMLMAVPKGESRKLASSIVVPGALVSTLTGTSEAIEFTFLFLAPWLFWGFHAIMAGIAGMITTIFIFWVPQIAPHVGFSFSQGLIDMFIYGIVPDIRGGGTHCWILLLLSLGYFPIYFLMFRWAIIKWNLKTPGRDGQTRLFTKADWVKKQGEKMNEVSNKKALMLQKATNVIKAYGGKQNIANIDACLTKLRVQVKDRSIVDEKRLIELGALGVTHPSPESVYAVFGQEADLIKVNMKEIIESENQEAKDDSALQK